MTPSEKSVAKPFLDFYTTHNIIPTHQDISDIESHVFRRNYLYRTLGLPPSLLKNKRALEFGPGTGDNAIATSMYGLDTYDFVDGNPSSVRELRRKLDLGLIKANTTKVAETNVYDYRDQVKYDLVIAEGIIPGQDRPKEFLNHIASFCTLGGIAVFTTTSYTSLLAEICRNVFRPAIVSEKKSFEQQVQIASNIFRDHLSTFSVSTRSIEDWVTDNILHNWLVSHSQVFSLVDALDTFGDRFQFYSSSPRFLVDYRWYKSVRRASPDFNGIVREQYHNFSALLLDYRVKQETIQRSQIDREWALRLEELCKQAFDIHLIICHDQNFNSLMNFIDTLHSISHILPAEMGETKSAITDYTHGIRKIARGEIDHQFGAFRSWWGRGQQYASFVREV